MQALAARPRWGTVRAHARRGEQEGETRRGPRLERRRARGRGGGRRGARRLGARAWGTLVVVQGAVWPGGGGRAALGARLAGGGGGYWQRLCARAQRNTARLTARERPLCALPLPLTLAAATDASPRTPLAPRLRSLRPALVASCHRRARARRSSRRLRPSRRQSAPAQQLLARAIPADRPSLAHCASSERPPWTPGRTSSR